MSERSPSREELEEEDAKGPEVHCATVSLGKNHLRREIERAAAERVGLAADGHNLRRPEIHQLQIALAIEDQVLRLQVSQNHVLVVQHLEDAQHIREVEGGLRKRKTAQFRGGESRGVQQLEEVSSVDILLDEVQAAGILESG